MKQIFSPLGLWALVLRFIFFKKIRRSPENGFTMLEVIVAIFIITVGVVGAFNVLPGIISQTSYSASQLTAAYLAQEGIEVIRNMRDNNWISNVNWKEGLTENPNNWEIDYASQSLENSFEDPGRLLRFYGGYFSYNLGGAETRFKRKVSITEESDYLKVSVQVFWNDKGTNRSIVAQENLYDWK